MWFYRTGHLGKFKSDDSGRKGTHRTRSRICADIKIKLVAPVRGRDHPMSSYVISVTGTRLDRIFWALSGQLFWAPCIATQVICRSFINFLTEFLISRFNYSFPILSSAMEVFIGQIQELKDFAQEFPAFQKAKQLQLRERGINSRVSRKAHELFTFSLPVSFWTRRGQIFKYFRDGPKIPPPKFSFDIVIDPKTKTPKQVFCKFCHG